MKISYIFLRKYALTVNNCETRIISTDSLDYSTGLAGL